MTADCWCEISAGHIISVFREIVQEEVTRSVAIGILYDLSVEWDLLNQRGYPKRGNLARGKQVIPGYFTRWPLVFHKMMSVITLITCRDQVCTSICSSFKIGHTMREICFNLPWIKSTSQIRSAWVLTSHHYGISPLFLQSSFHRETSLFSEVTPFKSQQFCRWL